MDKKWEIIKIAKFVDIYQVNFILIAGFHHFGQRELQITGQSEWINNSKINEVTKVKYLAVNQLNFMLNIRFLGIQIKKSYINFSIFNNKNEKWNIK